MDRISITTNGILPTYAAHVEGDQVTARIDEGHTVASWLGTTDHKRIAILYALSITVFWPSKGRQVPARW